MQIAVRHVENGETRLEFLERADRFGFISTVYALICLGGRPLTPNPVISPAGATWRFSAGKRLEVEAAYRRGHATHLRTLGPAVESELNALRGALEAFPAPSRWTPLPAALLGDLRGVPDPTWGERLRRLFGIRAPAG